MTETLLTYLNTGFTYLGLGDLLAHRMSLLSLLLIALLFSLLFGFLCWRFLTPVVLRIVEKTPTKLDDYLINRPVLRAICHIIPAVIFYELLPLCYTDLESASFILLNRLTQASISLGFVLLIAAFLKNVTTVATEALEKHHLVGIIQFIRLVTYCLGGIVIASQLIGHNPVHAIAGLGAAVTVLMFVFKDFILGLIAGIQLSANNMLKVGDWITIKKLDINGHVEQVTLTTVKIRNFDNTISTVPPYTLVSDSFQNWSGMFSKGLRRVKRALYIDIQSVHFCTADELQRLRQAHLAATADKASQTPTTNLTLFRHYLVKYLQDNKMVSNEQWLLVRQLEPTPHGLPLEVWFYATETNFVRFEDFASGCMEYFIATLPQFGLRHFQAPSGLDFQRLPYPATHQP